MEKDLELLAKLTMEMIELNQHLVMLLHQAELLVPPLREPVIQRLAGIAEMLDAASSADFPHELPVALKRTVHMLRHLPGHDQR